MQHLNATQRLILSCWDGMPFDMWFTHKEIKHYSRLSFTHRAIRYNCIKLEEMGLLESRRESYKNSSTILYYKRVK